MRFGFSFNNERNLYARFPDLIQKSKDMNGLLTLSWLSITPLGLPVVPDYHTNNTVLQPFFNKLPTFTTSDVMVLQRSLDWNRPTIAMLTFYHAHVYTCP